MIESLYENTVDSLLNSMNDKVRVLLEDERGKAKEEWLNIREIYSERPDDCQEALGCYLERLSELRTVCAAIARLDCIELFVPFKRTVEEIYSFSDQAGGYSAINDIPAAAAGYLYMSHCSICLKYESWETLRALMHEKFEFGNLHEPARFYYGFDFPGFYHNDVFDNSAPDAHDFYRSQLKSFLEGAPYKMESEEALQLYVQAQFLLSLRAAQLKRKGFAVRLWADFGRYRAARVKKVLDRAFNDKAYGDGILLLFDESKEEFFEQVNRRLATIETEFWSGGKFWWESLTVWEP